MLLQSSIAFLFIHFIHSFLDFKRYFLKYIGWNFTENNKTERNMPLSLKSISIYYYSKEKNLKEKIQCFSVFFFFFFHMCKYLADTDQSVYGDGGWRGERKSLSRFKERHDKNILEALHYTSLNLSHREFGNILQIQLSWSSVVAPRRVGW